MHFLIPTRLRVPIRTLGVVTLITAAAACGGSSKATPSSSSSRTDAATTSTDPRNGLHFTVKPTTVTATGTAGKLSARDTELARGLVKRYVELGMWQALRDGKAGTDFASLFTAEAQARVAPGAKDRGVLTDEGPKAPETERLDATITLHAITDPSGAVAVIAAEIDAVARSGPASTSRTGELLLVPNGKTWRVGGYQITVVRNPGDGTGPTTTTAKATP